MTKYFLSLDPSQASTGFAILALEEGNVRYVDGGYIDTRHAANPLRVIRGELSRIVGLYPIEQMVLKEGMFYKNNLATLALAKVHGVIEEALDGYTLVDVSSSTVRKVIGGHGRADKEMVADGVRHLLHLPLDYAFSRSDISDAASVALTYFLQNNMLPLTA